jgi:hypothetical protein
VPETSKRHPLLVVVPESCASYYQPTREANEAAMSRRNFFSRLAKHLYQFYAFPCALTKPTFGDVVRAIKDLTWRCRTIEVSNSTGAMPERSLENIPLPDIFDEKTWTILRACNSRVNRQMHCPKLKLNEFGNEVAIFEPLHLVTDEELLQSLSGIMKRMATTDDPEIRIMKYSTDDE